MSTESGALGVYLHETPMNRFATSKAVGSQCLAVYLVLSIGLLAPWPALASSASRSGTSSLNARALGGDAEACFRLGVAYDRGDGVKKNRVEAVRWFRRAAGLGEFTSQYNYAIALKYGDGIPADHKRAVFWFRKAAERGMPAAQVALGRCYEEDVGVESDCELALHWYRKAAEQGDPEGQFQVGSAYEGGTGVHADDR